MATKAPEEFKIVVDPVHDEGGYRPGSEVRGTLLVKVDSNRHYDHVVIHLVGKGHVHWTKTSMHNTSGQYGANFIMTTATRQADKLYVNESKSLWNKTEAAEGYLPTGSHSFPFCFVFPDGIPSTHESEVIIPNNIANDKGSGWTRYTLLARIEHEYDVHKAEKSLVFRENINVDTPGLRMPVEKRLIKMPGCFSCTSGSVTITLSLPKSGFHVNEEIPYRITIENGSSKVIEPTVFLKEYIRYHTKYRKCHTNATLLSQMNNGPVHPNHSAVLSPEVQTLKIPFSVIVIKNSSIIEQSFSLKVKVRIPGVICNPTIKCPLSIGNLPNASQQEPRPLRDVPPPESSSNL